MVYVTKEKQQTYRHHWEDLWLPWWKSITKFFDIHLKADYVEKDSIAKIEKQKNAMLMISDIVYDKQFVNLVNDNIKKVMWI
jgi:cell division transport system permease protein